MGAPLKRAVKILEVNVYIENGNNTNLHYKKDIRKWKRRLEVFMKLNLVK